MECGQWFGNRSIRIGALSALTGLPNDTIRFYEKRGLISSMASINPSNSYRDYGKTPERLRMITDARDAGLTIADMTFLIGYMETGDLGCVDINAFLDDRILQIQNTIKSRAAY